jgi:hypothetical protein
VDLSPEDQLRLNVMLAHEVEAIRIDESSMTVHALAGESEARVALNPNCRPEQYLKRVRELLSYRALGSPGGYPVFLQRWTRMGQHRDGQLDKLLLLGEPEAVIAVAGASGLTPELARRVWWTMPTSEIARSVLEREAVAACELGRIIANHLLEHLAFETEPLAVVQTIRLVLQPGLISPEARERLWARAVNRQLFHRLGFVEADADALPDPRPARELPGDERAVLAALAGAGNRVAERLLTLSDSTGQTFLAVSEELLRHPVDKYTVAVLLNAIGRYFAQARHASVEPARIEALLADPASLFDSLGAEATTLITAAPSLRNEIAAMLALAQVDETAVASTLGKTTATGTLLKRKLDPFLDLLLKQYAVLRGTPG